MATGKDLNKDFLNNVDAQIRELLNNGQTESTLSGNVVDVSGNNSCFVVRGEEDKFNALYALKNYLEFSTFQLEHTYEIFGAVVNENGREKVVSLFVREEDMAKLAAKADDYERLLGIRFPAQIHQFKARYAHSVIPGTNAPIPRPKLMSESDKDYEDFLEQTYADLNIEKKENVDGIGRRPYLHEQIDFRESDEFNEAYTSENYIRRFRADRAQSLGQQPNVGRARGNNRIGDNDRLTIRESEDVERTPLGRKIGSSLNSFDTFFKNEPLWRKIRLGALGGLAVGAVGVVAFSNPPLAVAAIWGAGVIGGGIFLGKKIQKIVSKKLNDWLYGPVLEQEERQEEPTPQRAPEPPQQPRRQAERPPVPPVEDDFQPEPPLRRPQPESQSTIVPEALDSFLKDAGMNMEQYREVENRVRVVEDELRRLTPGSVEYQLKDQELAVLKQQQREQLEVIEGLLQEMFHDFNIGKEEGRSLC